MTCASQAPQVPSHHHTHLRLGSTVYIELCALRPQACVSMAYYVYTTTKDSTVFALSLLTDAATQELHVCGESLTCIAVLLRCWQLRTHPNTTGGASAYNRPTYLLSI